MNEKLIGSLPQDASEEEMKEEIKEEIYSMNDMN